MRTGDDDQAVLRSKYHDWCSARVADRFVELSPEEIYQLAHATPGGGSGETSGRMRGLSEASASIDAGAFSFEDADYSEMVRRVTEVLATGMELPPFEEWAESYRADPERYEREMVGFWKSPLKTDS
jgi:hypothetical protein